MRPLRRTILSSGLIFLTLARTFMRIIAPFCMANDTLLNFVIRCEPFQNGAAEEFIQVYGNADCEKSYTRI